MSIGRLFRRHQKSCQHHGVTGWRLFTGCNCPVWIDQRVVSTDGRRRDLRSLGTRDWAEALNLAKDNRYARIASDVKAANDARDREARKPLDAAFDAYFIDCQARGLRESTIQVYHQARRYLMDFVGVSRFADELTLDTMTNFRAKLANGGLRSSTISKFFDSLKPFFHFCRRRDWMKRDPLDGLKIPRGQVQPTLPFSADEVCRIIAATDGLGTDGRTRLRAKALVLTLLYSGLRISDVAGLERRRLDATGRLLLYQQKTTEPVTMMLNHAAAEALRALPAENEQHFFWSGRGKLSTCIASLSGTLETLFKHARIEGRAHPHRFRDTFAVRLLEQGTPIRVVSQLLGHTSVRTTEKHYAPFSRGQQDLLDAATAKLDFVG
jgi:integrase/recombinase XerD